MVRTSTTNSSKTITPPRFYLVLHCRHVHGICISITLILFLPSFLPISSIPLLRSSQLQIKSVFCPGGSKKAAICTTPTRSHLIPNAQHISILLARMDPTFHARQCTRCIAYQLAEVGPDLFGGNEAAPKGRPTDRGRKRFCGVLAANKADVIAKTEVSEVNESRGRGWDS